MLHIFVLSQILNRMKMNLSPLKSHILELDAVFFRKLWFLGSQEFCDPRFPKFSTKWNVLKEFCFWNQKSKSWKLKSTNKSLSNFELFFLWSRKNPRKRSNLIQILWNLYFERGIWKMVSWKVVHFWQCKCTENAQGLAECQAPTPQYTFLVSCAFWQRLSVFFEFIMR
jgi:hypothetical protein